MINPLNRGELYGLERLWGTEVAPPTVLTVLPGQSVKVTALIDYKGPALSVKFYVAIGRRYPITGFAEWWVGWNLIPLSLGLDWKTYTMQAIVTIPATETATNLCDLYCKIDGYPGAGMPEYSGVIQVVGAPAFQNFKITDYSIA